jgi:hypothetical protein
VFPSNRHDLGSTRNIDEVRGAPTPPGGGFPWQDVIVLVCCALIAVPFAEAGSWLLWHDGETLKGLLAFAVAIPIGVGGVTFHWWKKGVSQGARTWVLSTADRWWPIALCFSFLYLIGIFPHPTTPESLSSPSKEVIRAVSEPLLSQIAGLS